MPQVEGVVIYTCKRLQRVVICLAGITFTLQSKLIMSLEHSLRIILLIAISLSSWTLLPAQATMEVTYHSLRGESGVANLGIPLHALHETTGTPFYRELRQNRLALQDMELIIFGADTLFRRFPEVDPAALWQLLVWGEYSLYRSVSPPDEASFVLYQHGVGRHLEARNFVRELNRKSRRKDRPLISRKSAFGTPPLMRATRRLNRRYAEEKAFVYTPFEVSRWQLETGLRIQLTSPFVLGTNREQDFGLAYHLGLNHRLFNHLPHFWLHLGLSQQTYRGNNTQIVIRQPDYLRSLRYSEWQSALGIRLEAAPRWALSPYLAASALAVLPTQTTYTQRSDPDRPRPSGLPFLVEQRGQGRLTLGYQAAVGLRVQLNDFWSFHAQYLGQRAPRVVNFRAPAESSELALDEEVSWQEFRQPALHFHLQFAIR